MTAAPPMRSTRVDLGVAQGATLGLVGESGCGKSVTSLAIMGLLPKHSAEVTGSIRFDGFDLLDVPDQTPARPARQPACHDLPGADDLAQSELHDRRSDHRNHPAPSRRLAERRAQAHDRTVAPGPYPLARAAHRRLSAQALRRHAPARHDRHGAGLRSPAADRRRAHHRARRHHAGADPRPDARTEGRTAAPRSS